MGGSREREDGNSRVCCSRAALAERMIRLEKTRKILQKYVRGRKLLSIGAGDGLELEGLNYSEATIVDLARRPTNLPERTKFIQADVLELDLPPESFDSVIMLELLEHIPPEHVMSLLRKVRTWIKSGGVLILTTPNIARLRNLFSLLFRGRPAGGAWKLPDKPTSPFGHLREYGIFELKDMLTRAGFQLVKLGGFSVTHLMVFQRIQVSRRIKYLLTAPSSIVPEYLWAVAEKR